MKRLLFFALLIFLLVPSKVFALDYYVSNGNDSGPGSLRQAIIDFNNAPTYTLVLSFSSSAANVNLYSPLPAIKASVIQVISFNYAVAIVVNGHNISGPVLRFDQAYGLIMFSNNITMTGVNFSSTTYTVTTNGEGKDSFRDAMFYAGQTQVVDRIVFNIPGMAPQQVLTTITGDGMFDVYYPVIIDGTTQPANGYTGGEPKIKLTFNNGSGFFTFYSSLELYGCNIDRITLNLNDIQNVNTYIIGASGKGNSFTNAQLRLKNSKNSYIQNNVFGADFSLSAFSACDVMVSNSNNLKILNNKSYGGWAAYKIELDTNSVIQGNKVGVNDSDDLIAVPHTALYSSYSVNLTLGGSLANQGNSLNGDNYTGNGNVVIDYATGVVIKGNKIGVYDNGTTPSKSLGLYVLRSSNITIGGNGTYEGNIIIGRGKGLYLSSVRNVSVYGNKISAYTFSPGWNDDAAIQISNGSISNCNELSENIEIGRTSNGYGNIITNSSYGVNIYGARQIKIQGNSFENNDIGIFLNRNFLDLTACTFLYSNNNIAAPVFTSLSNSGVTGTAPPNAQIHLYYSVSNTAFQGKTYIGSTIANAAGNWSYNSPLNTPCLLTATSTDANGNTSPFTQGIGNVSSSQIKSCLGSSVQLQATGGDQYLWTGNFLNNSAIGNPMAQIPYLGQQYYKVSITNSVTGCTGYKEVMVDTKSFTVSLRSDTTICSGDSIVLDAGVQTDATYLWSTGATTRTIKVGASTTSYKVQIVNAYGCNVRDTVMLTPVVCGLITGYVFHDVNEDCNKDVADKVQANRVVKATPGNYYSSTDANGYYELRLPYSSYQINQPVTDVFTTQPCGAAQNVNLSSGVSDTIHNIDFPNKITPHTDVAVSVSSGNTRLGQSVTYTILYKNRGDFSSNGTITVQLDTNLLFQSSSVPYLSVNKNLFTWDYTNLVEGEGRTITLVMSIPANPGLMGKKAKSIASAITDITDELLVNNIDSMATVYVNSYDPNDKTVYPGRGVNGDIMTSDTIISYTIRFQNTGTAPAIDVLITDTLSSDLNIASIEPGASSHPVEFSLTDHGVVKFYFPNINLPDSTSDLAASQGYVKFNIRLNKNLPVGTQIFNAANIYFDFNDAVVTNTTTTTIVNCLESGFSFNAKETPCIGEIVLIKPEVDEIQGGYTYVWSSEEQIVNPLAWNASTVIMNDAYYVLQLTDKYGCDSKDSILITIGNLAPEPTDVLKLCTGSTLSIGSAAVSNITYQWSPALSLDNSTSASPVASPIDTTAYYRRRTNALGCVTVDTVIVQVLNLPLANAGSDQNTCSSTQVTLGESYDQPQYSYVWSPSTGLDDATLAYPVATVTMDTEYRLEVRDENNCINRDTVMVRIITCTSTLSKQNELFSVYPNPTHQNVYIASSSVQEFEYQLTDLRGKLYLSGKGSVMDKPLDVSLLPDGLYVLTLYSGGNVYTQKISKIR